MKTILFANMGTGLEGENLLLSCNLFGFFPPSALLPNGYGTEFDCPSRQNAISFLAFPPSFPLFKIYIFCAGS